MQLQGRLLSRLVNQWIFLQVTLHFREPRHLPHSTRWADGQDRLVSADIYTTEVSLPALRFSRLCTIAVTECQSLTGTTTACVTCHQAAESKHVFGPFKRIPLHLSRAGELALDLPPLSFALVSVKGAGQRLRSLFQL